MKMRLRGNEIALIKKNKKSYKRRFCMWVEEEVLTVLIKE